MEFVMENSPHLRRKDNVFWMLLDVIIALAPVTIFSFVAFRELALRNILLPIAVMLIAEYLFVFIKFKPAEGKKTFKMLFQPKVIGFKAFNLLSAIVSGLIYGLMFPAQRGGIYFFILPVGALFGIIIGKLVFGGFGQNIFNPAAAGFVFAKACFSSLMTGEYVNYLCNDVTAGSTFLQGQPASVLDLFLGTTYGGIGEVCKAAILLGLAYLLIRHVADWRVVVSYAGTFIFLEFIAILVANTAASGGNIAGIGESLLLEILSGGFLFGLAFMITDPVTMPITAPSRVFYGMIGAVCAVLIRLFAAAPEGVGYSILLANLAAPALDYYKWSKNKFNWKHFLAYALIIVIFGGIVVWGTYGKVTNAPVEIALIGGAL